MFTNKNFSNKHIIDSRETGVKQTSPKNQLRLQYQWETLGKVEYRVVTPLGKLWIDYIGKTKLYDAKLVLEYERSPFSMEKNDASHFLKNKVRLGIKRELNRYKSALDVLQKNELVIVCNEPRVEQYFLELFWECHIPAKFVVYKPNFDNYKVVISNDKYKTAKHRQFVETIGCKWVEA